MKGPMKGATIGHSKQRITDGRYLGITEPGIIALAGSLVGDWIGAAGPANSGRSSSSPNRSIRPHLRQLPNAAD